MIYACVSEREALEDEVEMKDCESDEEDDEEEGEEKEEEEEEEEVEVDDGKEE